MTSEHQTGGEKDRGAVTYPLPQGIIVDRDVKVQMRDGAHLAATVFRPASQGRVPVVMCVTVYGKDLGPAEYSTLPKIKEAGMAVGTLFISDATTWEGPDPGYWVPNGYAVVVANARGFYESEGEPGIYSSQDAQDYADLIEWAGKQSWSNGSVGLNGVSYLAITQWMVASRTRPPHLKAIIPWEGVTDNLRDSLKHGGIPETRFLNAWLAGSLKRGAGDFMVTHGPAMIDEAAANPFPLENIDVPALVCASWSDHGLHSRGSIEGFSRISSRQKWLYTHGGNKWEVYYSPEALEWQKTFFDHFLKGEDNGFDSRPAVRLEIRRDREGVEVRAEHRWPPDRVQFRPQFLDLSGAKLTAKALHHGQSQIYSSESGETAEFDIQFGERTELTGPMALKLWVSALDADDLDLFAAVRKFDREGREIHFCGKDGFRDGVVALGWLRISERHLDPERSSQGRPYLSHDRIEKVSPGEIVPVEIEILPSSTVFECGETLRLMISGRDIMSHARFGHDDTVNRGRWQLHAGGEYASHLLAPICPTIDV